MEQGKLQDVESHVLHFRIEDLVEDGNLQKTVHSGVANGPLQGRKDVPLHLGEHVIIVERAAHGLELLDGGHPVLLVVELRGDEESCAANQLVVSLVDHSLGTVTVQEVDRQEQSRWQELERSVGLDQEVEKIGAHEPLNLSLDVDRFHVGDRLSL